MSEKIFTRAELIIITPEGSHVEWEITSIWKNEKEACDLLFDWQTKNARKWDAEYPGWTSARIVVYHETGNQIGLLERKIL